MDQENLENFFNSDDVVAKKNMPKACILFLGSLLLSSFLFAFKKIPIWGFVPLFSASLFPILLVFPVYTRFRRVEIRDNFFCGVCSLCFSVLSWAGGGLAGFYENYWSGHIMLVLGILWIFCAFLVCSGVMQNIKKNLYSPENKAKKVRLDARKDVYFINGLSTKTMFAILILMCLLQLILPQFFGEIVRREWSDRLLACSCWILGWLGIFGWKMIVKVVLLKKYTIE